MFNNEDIVLEILWFLRGESREMMLGHCWWVFCVVFKGLDSILL